VLASNRGVNGRSLTWGTPRDVPVGHYVSFVSCVIADFLGLVHQLEGVEQHDRERWSAFTVGGRGFGYLWPRTSTVGLKQTIAEQLGLVAERPEVFEIQFTSGAYGWVVVRLDAVERDELAELTFEAWRLSAPTDLVTTRADRLPV
jgi:hypothetical protein